MNLQMTYDLRTAEKGLPATVRKRIKDIGGCWHDTEMDSGKKKNRAVSS